MVIDFESRTNQKLEFARISLEEIKARPELGSADNFERSHEENFLFHLIGAKDSFLQEINVAYSLGLPDRGVKATRLLGALEHKGRESKELTEIIELKMNQDSWLALAIELRNMGSHRFHIRRHFEIGGEYNGKNFFYNPISGERMKTDIVEFLSQCLDNMKALLQRLRTTLPKS